MPRPAKSSSRRGLLLVEAVLSAVVIATGLVFISRDLAGQLKALKVMEEYDTLLAFSREKFLELEAEQLAGLPLAADRDGSFHLPGTGADGAAYAWRLAAEQQTELELDADGRPLVSKVTLTVRRHPEGSSPAVILSALWPTRWVPDEWFL